MPNISEVNQELVRAFNINLRFNGIAITNLTVQNLCGKDHIVISFDKNMDSKQCMGYLSDLRERIIKKSYKNEKAASISYNLQSFPFVFHKRQLDKDKRFSVVIDEGVVFNLKCYLAHALAGDVTEKIGRECGVKYAKEHIYDASFDRNSYLYCMLFRDEGLQIYFINSFLTEIEDYENAPSDYLEVDDNLVYIKRGIFDDVEFIKSIVEYNASLECRYLRASSAERQAVDKLKHTIIDFIDRATGIPVRTIIRTSYTESDENSVLIPLAQYGKFLKSFTEDDVNNLNCVFGRDVVTEIESHRLKNPYWESDYIYAIDFSDWDVSYCVMNKILENSVINKDYELTIDPELHFRALSPLPDKQLPNGHSHDGGGQGSSSEPPEKKSGILLSFHKLLRSKSLLNSPIHESEPSGSGTNRQTPLTAHQKKDLYSILSPQEEEISQLRLSQLEAEQLLLGESGNRNSQALSSSGYESSPGSSPESSLNSVDIAKCTQQCQEQQGDRVY